MVVDADGVERRREGDCGLPVVEVPVLAAVDGDPVGARLRDVESVRAVVPEHRDAPGLTDLGTRGVGGRLLERPIDGVGQVDVRRAFALGSLDTIGDHRAVVAEARRIDPDRRIRQERAVLGDPVGQIGGATVMPDLRSDGDVVVEPGDAESGTGHLESPDHGLGSQTALIEHGGDLAAWQGDLHRFAGLRQDSLRRGGCSEGQRSGAQLGHDDGIVRGPERVRGRDRTEGHRPGDDGGERENRAPPHAPAPLSRT